MIKSFYFQINSTKIAVKILIVKILESVAMSCFVPRLLLEVLSVSNIPSTTRLD